MDQEIRDYGRLYKMFITTREDLQQLNKLLDEMEEERMIKETMIDRLWQEAKRRFEEQMGPIEKHHEAWEKYNYYIMTGERK